MFAEVLPVYLACDRDRQAMVREMVGVLHRSNAATTERDAALETIAKTLFPSVPRPFSVSLDEYERSLGGGATEIDERLDREDANFASRLARLLDEKSVTQVELARRIGVSQSAISMLLARRCRPQRRTVARIAEALGVPETELWPEAEAEPRTRKAV
jgi:lambda repressor-like predicted transcriptional regulator